MNTTRYVEHDLQNAIIFLSDNFSKSGKNKKPVVLHSIRVASLLIDNNAPQTSVMAALLHDVLEDTEVSVSELYGRFGETITKMVISLTHEKQGTFQEKLNFSLDSYRSSHNLGYDTLIVRVCDLIDNSQYYHEAESADQRKYLFDKFTGFMKISQPMVTSSVYGAMLDKAYEENVAHLQNFANSY